MRAAMRVQARHQSRLGTIVRDAFAKTHIAEIGNFHTLQAGDGHW
jgi:hypothetical protein